MPRRRKVQTDFVSNLLVQLGMALGAIWRLISGRHQVRLNKERYQQHWKKITQLASQQTNQHNWQQAIIEGDKLLDQAFRELGLAGQTFADRLRAAESRLSHQTYQSVWEAHKLRNQIAHEVGYHLHQAAARQAVQSFERGLTAVGAL